MKKIMLFAAGLLLMNSMSLMAVEYNLKVMDVQVTDENAANVVADAAFYPELVNHVSFDPATSTLTLKASTHYTSALCPIIEADMDLNVEIEGFVSIYTYGKPTIIVHGENRTLTFNVPQGSRFRLNHESSTSPAIVMEANSTISFNGRGRYGFEQSSAACALVKASTMYANSIMTVDLWDNDSEENALQVEKLFIGERLMLDDDYCPFIKYDEVNHKLVWKDPEETMPILQVAFVAEPLKDGILLQIGETGVNSLIKDDIFGDGTVSYDDETSTLILNNAALEAEAPVAAVINCTSSDTPLTIWLKGKSTIAATGCDAIYSKSHVIITGKGVQSLLTINIDAQNGDAYAVRTFGGANLTIKEKAVVDIVEINAANPTLFVSDLTVDGADFRATVDNDGVAAVSLPFIITENGAEQLSAWEDKAIMWVGINATFPTEPATGVEEGERGKVKGEREKLLRDGAIYIMYDGQMYDVRGARVE